jgi:hypothetical protein
MRLCHSSMQSPISPLAQPSILFQRGEKYALSESVLHSHMPSLAPPTAST